MGTLLVNAEWQCKRIDRHERASWWQVPSLRATDHPTRWSLPYDPKVEVWLPGDLVRTSAGKEAFREMALGRSARGHERDCATIFGADGIDMTTVPLGARRRQLEGGFSA
jgi:hypothetical protein